MYFDYQNLVQKSFLGVVKEILSDVEKKGLADPHHFYITFKTNGFGVEIPSFLLEKYPDEMTIVLQHQFQNLTVSANKFEVSLSFGGQLQHLIIPFTALVSFVDPSVQFALQFKPALFNEKEETVQDTPAEIIEFAALRKKQ